MSPEIARPLTWAERLERRWGRIRRRLGGILRKLRSPTAVAAKARTVLHLPQLSGQVVMARTVAAPAKAEKKRFPPLGLQPADLVRVKTYEEIQKTLDENGRCEGCAFTFAMQQYCGRTFRVHKRINLFFDERSWKMLKTKNMVILEGAYCHSAPDVPLDWAGCDRSCFLFWKEAWLERA
jgi:hypothetical protein